VRSMVDWGTVDVHSEWRATAIFAPQNQAKVEKAFKEELARALKDGFTAQELVEGQRGLLNFRRLGRAQDQSVVGGWVRNLYIGQTFKRSAEVDAKLAKLTVDEVNAALRKYVKPDAYVAAFAGDFKAP
jgi:zinc protease